MRIIPTEPDINPDDPFGPDLLRMIELADGFTNLVTTVRHPLVLALDGPWGSGKSTFLKQWKVKLANEKPDFPVIYFDAFENDYVEDAFAALTREVVALLEEKSGKELKSFKKAAVDCGSVLLRAGVRLGIKAGVRAITLNTVTPGDLSDFKEDLQAETADAASTLFEKLLEKPTQQKDAIEQFRKTLSQLPAKLAGSTKGDVPLIFIIDELDRCRPAFALSILERIKHFMSVPNVHFILGVHLHQLRNSVKAEYGGDIDAHLYLQKFISLVVTMPEPTEDVLPGRHAIYIKHLNSSLTPQDAMTGLVDDTMKYFTTISERNNFTLRTMQKIFSSILIYFSFSRAVFVRIESLGDSRIDVLLIQRGGWRKEASLDDKAPLARSS